MPEKVAPVVFYWHVMLAFFGYYQKLIVFDQPINQASKESINQFIYT